jgi:hypothetical protein
MEAPALGNGIVMDFPRAQGMSGSPILGDGTASKEKRVLALDRKIMTENQYQATIIKKLKRLFPGCVVIKTDSGYQQGSTDLILLFRQFWAALEVKTSAKARMQPNQKYFVKKLNGMSFAAFIYPENEAEVLSALQQTFAVSG